MAPPAVVYVVAAVVGVAAVFAFKEFVYEPHIAPTFEAWAEDFLERRRAARGRRASAVPVRSSHRRNSSSSISSLQDNRPQRDQNDGEGVHRLNDLKTFELEALAPREVDEWRNEVLRSQEQEKDGLRKRRTRRVKDDFDGFGSTSTTLDESFTSLTHTPLASTHVISNVSSPITPSTVSLPQTPARQPRSVSQLTTQGDVGTSFTVPDFPSPPVGILSLALPGSAVSTPRPPTDSVSHLETTPSLPLAIPIADRRSPTTGEVSHPLPFTTTHQVTADDSPFGPLLPDTPRLSAEMYGERPFSPIVRVMESSSGSVPIAGSNRTLSSSANSTSSFRTLGSSGVLGKASGLVNEVVDGSVEEDQLCASASAFIPAKHAIGINGSVISSLSERYPAPPTPPVILSPPASSVGIISAPSSPRSSGSEVVVHRDTLASGPHPSFLPLPQAHSSLPTLQLPPESSNPLLVSRSQSSTHPITSPALSYTSFLSPSPVSRTASESEGDEFLSIASNDSDWNGSPITPGRRSGPMRDGASNPFLDFEYLAPDATASGSEHGGGSEGSEVLVFDLGHEGGSEISSEESWGSARRR